MRRATVFVVVSLGAALLVAVPGGLARAAFPGDNGLIAYSIHTADGHLILHTIDPNGSGGGGALGQDDQDAMAAWSPSGDQLAVTASSNGEPSHIVVMDADGGNEHQVVDPSSFGPGWSPDGTQIAYACVCAPAETIKLADVATGASTPTPYQHSIDNRISWSPDGQKLAFSDFNNVAWIANADGSGEHQLSGSASHPDWSPDGSQLVYEKIANNARQLHVIGADGQNDTAITGSGYTYPAWSPDGQEIVAEHATSPGHFELVTMNADGSGQQPLSIALGNGESLGLASPAWQPIPHTCQPGQVPLVQVSFATAEGCFTERKDSLGNPTGVYETPDEAWVGGFDVQPRPAGLLVVDTNVPEVRSEGAGTDIVFDGFVAPFDVDDLPVDFPSASLDFNQNGGIDKLLLDIPIDGKVKVSWSSGGKASSLEGEINLDHLTGPLGALVEQPSGGGEGSGKVKLTLTNRIGLQVSSAEASIDAITVLPKVFKGKHPFTLKNLLVKYEKKADPSTGDLKPFWTGQAGIELPGKGTASLDVTGTVFFFDGHLAGGGIEVDGINKPIPDTPLVFQKVSGKLIFAPTFGLNLGVGATFGPKVGDDKLASLDVSMTAGSLVSSSDCTAGIDPLEFQGTLKLLPLEDAELRGLLKTEFTVTTCYYLVGAGLGMDTSGTFKLKFPAVEYNSGIAGFVGTSGADLEANGTLKVALLPAVQARGIVSSKGMAVCGSLNFAQIGFGHSWGDPFLPPQVFHACDVTPYRVTVPHLRATSTSFAVPDGLPHVAFEATAAGHAPRVRVTGPGGVSFTSPAQGAVHNDHVIIWPDAATSTTFVLVNDPAGGDWQVAGLGSALTKVGMAKGERPLHVSGQVQGTGRQQAFTYAIGPHPGETVQFFERGDGGIDHLIGTATGSGGVLHFQSSLGLERQRTIVAVPGQDGAPLPEVTVAHFTAPPIPALGTPKLHAVRTASSLDVTWRSVANATSYLVTVTDGNIELGKLITTGTEVTVDGTPSTDTLTAKVQALSEVTLPGPVARIDVAPPSP